ncbi:MAG: acylphosphatase [Polaribacter sp.]|jgi:acylphosphatase
MRVYGKVQGVWFRASTKRKADELGLVGMVKNEKDGSVYVEVQGTEAALNDFRTWCSVGPELAQVEKVIIEEMEEKLFLGFEVARL